MMDTLDIQDILRPLLRWWWLLAACTLLAAGFSAYSVMNQPPTYRSYTTLMVGTALANPNPSGSEFMLASQLAATYADIARRSTIYNATKDALGLPRLPDYAVLQVPNTQIIEITVTDTDPQRAQIVAQELVNQLMLQTPGGRDVSDRQSFVDQQLDEMEQSILATQEEIRRLNRELEGLFSAREIANTNNQIAALESKKAALQSNYAALLENSQRGASNTLNVLEPANLPTSPVENSALMMVLAAGALGFALAAAAAYLLEYLDDTFRYEDEVHQRLDLQTLGTIPDIGRRAQRDGALDLAAVNHSPASHAFGGLRIALEAASVDRPVNILLISSPGSSEGKSFIAANLSVEMAQSGQRVILVDADLRRPSQQRLFRLHNQAGLTTLFQREQLAIDALLQPTSTAGLSVLTSGPLPANPAQILSSARMQALLKSLQEKADMVIVDAPPLTAAIDASLLATHADGVLMVIAMGRTRRHLTLRTVKMLRQLRVNLLGFVLDQTSLKASHYSHTYGYDTRSASARTSSPFNNPLMFHRNGNGTPEPTSRRRPTAQVDKAGSDAERSG